MAKNEWVDVSHEIKNSNDGWEDVSHELKSDKPSLLKQAGQKIAGAFDTLDSYTGAPTMSAIGKLQDTGSLSDAGQAFVNQFGEHTEFAPAGKEIMQKAGLTDRPWSDFIPGTAGAGGGIVPNPFSASVSGTAGMALRAAADPTLYVPFGAIGKGVKTAAVAAKEASGVAKVGEVLTEYLKAVPKENSKQIIEAAQRLGIKVTPGMLDGTGTIAQTEYTLAKSPSIFSGPIKNAQANVVEGVDKAVAGALESRSTLSPYEIGNEFKSGLSAKVGERLDPISATFDDVAQSTKNISVSEKSKDAIIRNIENTKEYRLTGGKGKPGEYVEMIRRIENADDAKSVMTMLNKDIKVAEGSELQSLLAIKGKVANFEKNSIMRGAIQAAREGGMRTSTGAVIGREVVGDLKGARVGYRDLAKDLNDIAENTRAEFKGGPSGFLDDVEKITNEDIQKKFFNTQNLRQIQNLKEKFPEQFELLKQGKLQEIAKKSLIPVSAGEEGISANKFITEVNKLNPEVKQLLFGKKTQVLADVETIQRSLPKDFNPSQTANQSRWSKEALLSNATDIPNYLKYRYQAGQLKNEIMGGAKAAVNSPRNVGPALIPDKASAFKGIQAGAKQIIQNEQLKGVDRWIANGQQRVIETDASLDPEFLKQYQQSKQGKDDLIRASEISPKSNRMNEIINRIKSSQEYKQFLKQKEKSAQGKEPDQSSVKPKMKFPVIVQKDGYTAVVRNDQELAEAKSEGWA